MASDNAYCTAAQVKARIELYDTSITDATIDQMISNAEALINALAHKIWSATVPPFVEGLTITIAAFYVWSFNPEGGATASESALVADMLWAEMQQGIQLLKDERFVNQLGGS